MLLRILVRFRNEVIIINHEIYCTESSLSVALQFHTHDHESHDECVLQRHHHHWRVEHSNCKLDLLKVIGWASDILWKSQQSIYRWRTHIKFLWKRYKFPDCS